MPSPQVEADALFQTPKESLEDDPLEFPCSEALRYERALRSVDRRELFLFDFERGNRNRARLKYHTRARKLSMFPRRSTRSSRPCWPSTTCLSWVRSTSCRCSRRTWPGFWKAFTFINHAEHPPNEDNLAAIRAYDIQPRLRSRRGEALAALNGG